MSKFQSQKGQVAAILVVAVIAVVGVIAAANYKITKTYAVQQNANVQGVNFSDLVGKAHLVEDAGKSAVVRGNVGALFSSPVEVKVEGDQVVATVGGQKKTLAVLPDEAVKLAQSAKVITEAKSVDVGKTGLASINKMVTLAEKDGQVGYEINGYKKHVLGVSTSVDAFVSAENGQVLETTQSLLGRILNKLSK